MSASPNDAAIELAFAAGAAGVSIEALVTALVSLPADAGAPVGAPACAAVAPVTVGAHLASAVEPALTKGKRTVWRPYMRLMTQGYPDLCACMCDPCLEAFRGAGRSKSTTGRIRTMKVTEKGQITIPKEIRDALGIGAGTEVEFECDNETIVVRKASDRPTRGRQLAERLRGRGDVAMTTSEIMALTREA